MEKTLIFSTFLNELFSLHHFWFYQSLSTSTSAHVFIKKIVPGY